MGARPFHHNRIVENLGERGIGEGYRGQEAPFAAQAEAPTGESRTAGASATPKDPQDCRATETRRTPGGKLMKSRYLAILATLSFLFLFHPTMAQAQSVTTEYVCLSNCDAGDTVSTVATLQSGTLTGIGTEAVLVEKLTLQFSNSSLSQTACQTPSAPSDCVNVIDPGAPPHTPRERSPQFSMMGCLPALIR